VLLLETIVSARLRAHAIGSAIAKLMWQPKAGFEIDQAMAALPAHASLPDGRAWKDHAAAVVLCSPGRTCCGPVLEVAASPFRRQAAKGHMRGGACCPIAVGLVRCEFAVSLAVKTWRARQVAPRST
jgi:hypothetical protein